MHREQTHAALLTRAEAAEQREQAATAAAATLRTALTRYINYDGDCAGCCETVVGHELCGPCRYCQGKAALAATPDDGQRGREQRVIDAARRLWTNIVVQRYTTILGVEPGDAYALRDALKSLDTPPATTNHLPIATNIDGIGSEPTDIDVIPGNQRPMPKRKFEALKRRIIKAMLHDYPDYARMMDEATITVSGAQWEELDQALAQALTPPAAGQEGT